MANPFSGIISNELKLLFNNAIDALLEDNALTVPCELRYGITKTTICPNCIYDPINKKSSNRYKAGGPVSFASGQICPYCNGVGLTGEESTEEVFLCVIWDYKQWRKLGFNLLSPEGFVVTLCGMNKLPQIKSAKEVIIDTRISPHVQHRFVREGEPNPLGLGESRYISTLWKRAG
jgi:hypothetical protein